MFHHECELESKPNFPARGFKINNSSYTYSKAEKFSKALFYHRSCPLDSDNPITKFLGKPGSR